MKTLGELKYFAPKTLAEAVLLLGRYREEAKILAGGTDLVPLMKDRILTPRYIVDIKTIPELSYVIGNGKQGLKVGALTKIVTILESGGIKSNHISLYEAASSLGAAQVRNMATIGGNICRSSPSADMVPPLMIFDAELKLVGPDGERTLLLEDFYTGPGKNVLNNEILVEIELPPSTERYGTAFRKIARTSEDLAKVNCAVKIAFVDRICRDIGIALGAVAPMPIRARKTEKALRGKRINDETIKEAISKVCEDISPIDDCRSDISYRTQICQTLIRLLLDKAIERLEDNGKHDCY
ncbi:FAD binding domain-containing protein [Chloroflexota bacterium]